MTQKTDRTTWLVVAALMVGAVLLGWQEVSGGILPEGSEAPPFVLERLDGSRVELTALKGKVVVINFWATWCPPCREEMPYLVKLVKERAADGVELVAISNDDLDGQREAVERYVRVLPEVQPYVALGRPEVGAIYEVAALPSVFVLDRDGHVLVSHQGQASESQLRRWIGKALEH